MLTLSRLSSSPTVSGRLNDPDVGGKISRQITRSGVRGEVAAAEIDRRGKMVRTVIQLRPSRLPGLSVRSTFGEGCRVTRGDC